VFILFNIPMGALAMPRTNLILSLTCRNVLSEMLISVPAAGDMARDMMGGGASIAEAPFPTSASLAAILIGEHNDQCSIKEVEPATALLALWGNLVAGILGAIVTPVWGRLSVRYGRMKPLGAATTIMLLSQVVELLMAVLPDVFSLKLLRLSFIFEGLR
jgi:MFS family permease